MTDFYEEMNIRRKISHLISDYCIARDARPILDIINDIQECRAQLGLDPWVPPDTASQSAIKNEFMVDLYKKRDAPIYIVLRPCKELEGKVSKYYDGYWYNLKDVPVSLNPSEHEWGKAHPSYKFETRDSDGAKAEIWIVEPNANFKQEGGYW